MAATGTRLRPGLTTDTAVDRYLAMVLNEIYRTLVAERDWTPTTTTSGSAKHLSNSCPARTSLPTGDHQSASDVSR